MSKSKNREEKNPAWKGDKASYRAKHIWVQFHYGKANHCEFDLTHTSTRFHWSNKSGRYERDISDWQQLCPKCHKGYDKKMNGHNWKRPSNNNCCQKGHEYTPDNTRVRSSSRGTWRVCKQCANDYGRAYYQKRKVA